MLAARARPRTGEPAFGLEMSVQPVSLPPNHALRGLVCFGQAAVLAPASPGGFALSQGQRLGVGD